MKISKAILEYLVPISGLYGILTLLVIGLFNHFKIRDIKYKNVSLPGLVFVVGFFLMAVGLFKFQNNINYRGVNNDFDEIIERTLINSNLNYERKTYEINRFYRSKNTYSFLGQGIVGGEKRTIPISYRRNSKGALRLMEGRYGLSILEDENYYSSYLDLSFMSDTSINAYKDYKNRDSYGSIFEDYYYDNGLGLTTSLNTKDMVVYPIGFILFIIIGLVIWNRNRNLDYYFNKSEEKNLRIIYYEK